MLLNRAPADPQGTPGAETKSLNSGGSRPVCGLRAIHQPGDKQVKKRTLQATIIAALAAASCLAAVGSAQAATLPNLTLTLTNSSITVGGATQSGAVNIVTTATGVKGEASAILFLLKPGATFEEVEAAIQQAHGEINVTSKYGSLVFNAEATSGHTGEAQTYLQPGNYVAVLPGGEGKGSKAHALFTVTPAATPAALPTPEATIRSIEFGFRGPSTLRDGELVRFENEGFLVHMDVAAPVKNMKAAKQAIKDLLAGKEKAIEKLISGPPVGFAGSVSHEAFQQETITAKPGIYVEACFMDTQDGRSHTQLGMERIIKIVK
jgi:hypothetical protein